MTTALFTFDSTHMALWAEEIARDVGIAVEVVPTPPGTGALCDLALLTAAASREALAEALTAAGVSYRHSRPTA